MKSYWRRNLIKIRQRWKKIKKINIFKIDMKKYIIQKSIKRTWKDTRIIKTQPKHIALVIALLNDQNITFVTAKYDNFTTQNSEREHLALRQKYLSSLPLEILETWNSKHRSCFGGDRGADKIIAIQVAGGRSSLVETLGCEKVCVLVFFCFSFESHSNLLDHIANVKIRQR